MQNREMAVVVTGASSGIGRSCVERMTRAGWRVFATVRTATDRDALQRRPGVISVLMDLEDGLSIKSAAVEIETYLNGGGLDGLVNVAGIGMVRPVEYASMDEIRQIFEINFFGQLAMIQALSRLLRQKRGRIVNITTVGVNLAIPFGGLLNASKSAFAMMSDTLRLEMHPFGVRVCAIEPGAVSTPAVDKTLGHLEQVIAGLSPEAQSQYGSLIRKFGKRGYKMEKNGSPPEVIALAVHHALTSNRPRIRYRVGRHAKLLAALPRILPESVMDAIAIRMFGLTAPDQSTSAAAGASEKRRPAHSHRAALVNPK
ncbi:MAG TPA: SDR family NAD(P)-dependent oxidoreductase [Candidatus Binatia bacterium]|nr:SDR family NAD(P)-dependent oxidoreductase [Candidatus Binatia bacterium]